MFLANSAKIALVCVVGSLRHPFTVGKYLFQRLLKAVVIHSEWDKCSVAKRKYILRRMQCPLRRGEKKALNFMHW